MKTVFPLLALCASLPPAVPAAEPAPAARVVVRGDHVVPPSWGLVPIMGRTLYCNIGWGWEPLHAEHPELAMFDNPYISVGGALYVNDIAKIEFTDPPKNAWTNLPVRFSEVFASKDWKGARKRLADFEKNWPDAPFSIYCHGASPPCILKKRFDTDTADFAAWRARHPGFYSFECFGEYDSSMHGFSWKRRERVTDPALVARYDSQYVPSGDYFFPRQWIDVDIAKLRSYFFDSDDLSGMWTILPSFGHHEARVGIKFLYYEAEHATTASPWRWGGMYARGAARQFRVPFGWYSAMYTSTSVMRNGKSPVGVAGVRGGRDTFTYWPNPNQPDRVPHLGSSRSLLRRNVRYGFFIGGQIAQIECSCYSIYATAADGKGWTLSPYGEDYNDVFEWCRHYDRGVVYAPIALLTSIDEHIHRQGTAVFPRKDACSIPAFLFTLVPAHSRNITRFVIPERGEEGCLWNSEFGEIADVVCPDAGQPTGELTDRLNGYKAAFLVGHHDPARIDVAALKAYVRAGGTLFCSCEQVTDALVPASMAGVSFTDETRPLGRAVLDETGKKVESFAEAYTARLGRPSAAKPFLTDENGAVIAWTADYGKGRVVTVAVRRMMPDAFQSLDETAVKTNIWTWRHYPSVARGERTFPIIRYLLRRAQRETMPVAVSGDIQWGLNKTADGWLLWLINNKGIAKFALEPEDVDLSKTATVTVDLAALAGLTVTDVSAPTPAGARPVAVKDGRFTVKVRPGEDVRLAIR